MKEGLEQAVRMPSSTQPNVVHSTRILPFTVITQPVYSQTQNLTTRFGSASRQAAASFVLSRNTAILWYGTDRVRGEVGVRNRLRDIGQLLRGPYPPIVLATSFSRRRHGARIPIFVNVRMDDCAALRMLRVRYMEQG